MQFLSKDSELSTQLYKPPSFESCKCVTFFRFSRINSDHEAIEGRENYSLVLNVNWNHKLC